MSGRVGECLDHVAFPRGVKGRMKKKRKKKSGEEKSKRIEWGYMGERFRQEIDSTSIGKSDKRLKTD